VDDDDHDDFGWPSPPVACDAFADRRPSHVHDAIHG
jgi:hypothetical protein